MAHSDEEGDAFSKGGRRSRGRSPTRSSTVNSASSSGGIVTGAIVAGVAVIGAIGAHFFLKKKPAQASTRPSSARSQRRAIPPRRPRSTTSGASSRTHSPTASSTGTPVKRQTPTSSTTSRPALPPRKPAASKGPAPAATSAASPKEPTSGSSSGAALAAAAAAATATAAVAATAIAADPKPEPVAPVSDTAAALVNEAAVEIERLQAAASADDAAAAAKVAEEIEDTVDDQIQLAKEEAVVAVVGIVEAAADAEDAAADADQVLAAAVAAGDSDSASAAAPAAVDVKKEEATKPMLPPRNAKNAKKGGKSSKAPAAPKSAPQAPAPPQDNAVGAAVDAMAAAAAASAVAPIAKKEDEAPPTPPEDEADDQIERLDETPHPTLSFESAPKQEEPLTELEEKARSMSVHSHKLIQENHKVMQALKEQQAALDLVLGPEGSGKVRPSLVAACAFSLADMLVALKKTSETKVALATAYDASGHLEGKGGMIRALMNYAYVLRNDGKPKSARLAYDTALEMAKSDLGECHPTVEQVKYEYSAYLAKVGRIQEGTALLLSGADLLLAEGEKLDKEVAAKADTEEEGSAAAGAAAASKEPEAPKKADDDDDDDMPALIDPGSGLEHIVAEAEASAAAEGEETLPENMIPRHFAMRNLMNAAGLLDVQGEHDQAHAALSRAVELAIEVHGENSVHHMNTLYAIGVHCKRRGALEDAIAAHEHVLNIMDETIEVYEPELLQNRVSILKDTAELYDEAGDPAAALDYAQGALVNAQTLAKIMSASGASVAMRATMLEPFWQLMVDLKTKTGDLEGAAEAKREALRGKLNQGKAQRSGRGGANGAGRGTGSGGAKRPQNKPAGRR